MGRRLGTDQSPWLTRTRRTREHAERTDARDSPRSSAAIGSESFARRVASRSELPGGEDRRHVVIRRILLGDYGLDKAVGPLSVRCFLYPPRTNEAFLLQATVSFRHSSDPLLCQVNSRTNL